MTLNELSNASGLSILSILIKPFSNMTKNSEQKFKYLRNEKNF